MSVEVLSLDDIRREIDAIDDAIHDLLMRRAALIDPVTTAKRRSPGELASPLRPAREAVVLRRLDARHRGPLPPAVVLRTWRELMSASAAMQAPLSVAVCAPERSVAYWDLARNHFGSSTPMTLHRSATLVLNAVSDRPGAVGLFPLPQDGEREPWWVALTGKALGEQSPQVIWRLPFYFSPAGRYEDLAALAVAFVQPEPTGRDITLASVEIKSDVSRGRLADAMHVAGFEAQIVAVHDLAGAGVRLNLVEIAGFVAPDDPRFASLHGVMAEAMPRVAVLGAYPVPLADGGATG